MSPDFVVQILRDMFVAAFMLSLPLLGVGFVAGIVISLIQIVTSIQDTGFNTVPRLLAFLAALMLMMPWMMGKLMTYSVNILGHLDRFAQ